MIDRIAVDPEIHFGKPCIAGTRITVQCVLELVEEGIPFNEIIRDYYPDLTIEDIHACLRARARCRSPLSADAASYAERGA